MRIRKDDDWPPQPIEVIGSSGEKLGVMTRAIFDWRARASTWSR
jgi:hypothetical protein